MNTGKSFPLSSALIFENLKMYWYVPALSFTVYFMSGIFPILINTDESEFMARFIYDSLRNYSAPYCILMIFVPLVAAVTMMGFLHKPARAMAIHSQPFSRSKIFYSHILTGWFMTVIPVIFMTLFYLLFQRDMHLKPGFYYQSSVLESYETGNIYTPENIFLWFFSSLAIITFFYGMYVLAGSLTGNSTMQVLICGIFFIIVPLTLWLSIMYFENFLYGFTEIPEWAVHLMNDANPILYILFNTDGTTTSMNLGYLFSALIMILAARIAYEKASLERVGDSIIYRIIEEIITYLVVFVGMTVFGFFFYSMADHKAVMLIGMAAGTFITFIIVKIVLNKSIHIINKRNFRSLAVYLLIAALFAAFAVYDAGGYAKRIPQLSEIQSVDCYDFLPGYSSYSYHGHASEDAPSEEKNYNKELTSEDSIRKVLALHQYIVEHDLYQHDLASGAMIYDSAGDPTMLSNEYIRFTYKLKNGRTLSRFFDVSLDETAASLINDILCGKEYLDNISLANNIDFNKVSYLQIYLYYSYFEDESMQSGNIADAEPAEQETEDGESAILILNDRQKIKEFLAALDEDHYNKKYTADVETSFRDGISVSGEIYLEGSSDEISVSFYLTRQNTAARSLLAEFCREEGYDFFADKLSRPETAKETLP